MNINKIKKEFEKLGYQPDINELDKLIIDNVTELLEIFSEQGHSGFSAPYAISCFKKLSTFDIEGAKKEFIRMGYKPIEELEDDIDKWIQEGTLDLLKTYLNQKQIGVSAQKVIEYFSTIAMHEPLAPILCTDDEWNDITEINDGEIMFQNNRLSSVFREGKNGKPYYLDAIVWKNQKGDTYTGNCILNSNGDKIKSSQIIKLPFTPKTFYIDVFDYEIGESKIVDESQLDEVWKYYENPIKEIRKEKLKKLDE